MYLLLIFSGFCLFGFCFYLFIFGCAGSLLLFWASSSGGERGYSSLQSVQGLIVVASLVAEHSSRHAGFSSCGSQA